MTVSDFLIRWLAEYAEHRVCGLTFESYERIVRRHLIPALGEQDLAELTSAQIQSYLHEKRCRSRLDGGGLSACTVAQHHRVLHKALVCAVDWRLLDSNPASRVTAPRVQPRWVRVLDEEATKQLLRSLRGHPVYLPSLIAVGTGMRRGEILGLHWSEVDLPRRVLAVIRSLEQTSKGLAFKAPKTRRSRRLIALPGFVVHELEQQRRHRGAEVGRVGQAEQWGVVVTRPDGAPWPPNSFSRAFGEVLRARGLPRIRFHDLRHGHASHLLRQGVHPKVVSERLGHTSVGFTLDTYSHLLPGMQAEAAAMIDRALG